MELKSLRIALLSSLIILFLSCGQDEEYKSPKALFVDYISSHTAGVVSKASSIKIKLSRDLEDTAIGEAAEKNLLEIEPDINGELIWEDARTLLFKPEKALESNETYGVIFHLGKLFPELDEAKSEYRFQFKTLKQDYQVEIDGLRYENEKDLSKADVHGRLLSADLIDEAELESFATAEQAGKELNIQWQKGSGNTYEFLIKNASRSKKASLVEMEFDGKALGIDKDTDLEYEIPSIEDFKVLSGRLVKGRENYISILLSDPIKSSQNLDGLIYLTGMSQAPRLVIEKNEVKIYPTGNMPEVSNLTLSAGIQNTAGYKLQDDFVKEFVLEQIKPELKMVEGMDKTIMPASNGLIVPFQAVALGAVDLKIIRIFPNNVLQYLQVNNLGGDYQLRRVARPVVRKTVSLSDNGLIDLNSWNTFTIDLEKYIEPEAGAIYQVELGFRKKHSLYFCSDSEANQNEEEFFDDWSDTEEDSYWDSSEDYYYYGYDWSERDNPCSDSYYGSRRSIRKILFSSDLGIIAKSSGAKEVSVIVSNLISTDPISGVNIEIYDYQQQLIGKGNTDGEGQVQIEISNKPFALIAKNGNDISYLRLDEGNALSMSNFDVTGNTIKNGIKGFIYGERGVWRPGDTIHLAFMLQESGKSLPENHPVITEFYNPLGQLKHRAVNADPVANIYRFDLKTEPEDPTGNWFVKTKVGGALFEKRIKVETIKPNRLKINLDFEKELFTANDISANADLHVNWLSGGTASNLLVKYEMLLKPIKTRFESFPNFSFDDISRNFYSYRKKVFEGRTNAEGDARISFPIETEYQAPGALQANLYGTVFEPGGDFSIANTSIKYLPYESFVGLKLPEGDKRGMLLTDKDHTVEIVSLDANGQKISRNGLEVKLYKVDWKWWWDKTEDNISNYVASSYHSAIQSAIINTQNGKGAWKLRIDYPEWGRYYVRVEDPVSGHAAGKIVYIDWPGWAGKGKRGDLGGAAMLDFGVEKSEYNLGEEVKITVPSTEGNNILVSLETGTRVIKSFWVKSEKDKTNISFETTADMAPNVYANISMIQAHGQNESDLPLRLYGVQSIKVSDKNTILEPQISMPKELKPEQEFTVSVSESNNRAMAYTIAVVDEGLLDITNYKTPEPWSTFFGKEALGIKTWDIYDDVMGAFSADFGDLLAIGGDGDFEEAEDKKNTNRFKPVVKYLGPFKLDAGEKGSHKIQMPQYVGSVKTMVVASGNGAYGSAEKVTPVKQPLMILATLPRVAGPNENIKLPVNIFMDGKNSQVTLEVKATGALKVNGSNRKTVNVNSSSGEVVFFDLLAESFTGSSKVEVKALSGQHKASYDVEMEVIPRNPMITNTEEKVLTSNESWSTYYQPLGIEGHNSASLEISQMPSLNIEKRLNYLIQYPHGCVEQTTSSVFAQLFLDKLMNLSDTRKTQIQNNINSAINRLKSFQLPSGGLSYWPGGNYDSKWGSNYAGHFLVEAKNKGYDVPESMLSSLSSYFSNQAKIWSMSNAYDNSDIVQAYRLYVLAKMGKAEMGAMNRMKENNSISIMARWRLALAYAVAGYEQEAKALVNNVSTDVPNQKQYYQNATFGSDLRDKAMILETQAYLNQEVPAFESLMEIAEEMSDKNKWFSTQTTAYCFVGIAKYMSNYPGSESQNLEVTFGNNVVALNGKEYVQAFEIRNPDEAAPIKIRNAGGKPVFAKLIRTGVPIEGLETDFEKNIRMTISYFDGNGNSIDPSRLSQGTDFRARINIRNTGQKGDFTEMALTQIFPSGWEITNTRLDGSAQNSKAEYIDIRDDRVMHYFDLRANQIIQFDVLLQAAYAGKYYLPAVKVEAMYDNDIRANNSGKWVRVLGTD